MTTKYLTAPNMRMPVVGLGTAKSGVELETTIGLALEAGYRHIDTAYAYRNEQFVGYAVNKYIETGRLERPELFIVTKLAPTHLRPEHVEKSLRESLEKLQLSYVDLYLIHNPVGLLFPESHSPKGKTIGELPLDESTDLVACWKAMELLVDMGLSKAIGLSNFNVNQIRLILKVCRIKPANLQVELHVHFQQPDLVDFCRGNGITITAYGPLGSPGRLDPKTAQQNDSAVSHPMIEPAVAEIAKHHKKSPSQILLKYLLQLGVAVIPKSSNPDRLKANIDLFDFKLTNEECELLAALDRGDEGRQFWTSGMLAMMKSHPEFPYPEIFSDTKCKQKGRVVAAAASGDGEDLGLSKYFERDWSFLTLI